MLGETFDPKAKFAIREHCRLHWSQAGAIVFITFRTIDSIPREVITRWEREKQDWLRQRKLNPQELHWSQVVSGLEERPRHAFKREFRRTREAFLDTCHGRCLLKRPELAQIVADSLLHFHGERYRMGDFVVMPNHIHLMAAFDSEETMAKQCDSWLHYTAFRIHQSIGEKGHFWQEEPFDHLVRSPEQYDYLREYIAENPKTAKLKSGEYHYRRSEG